MVSQLLEKKKRKAYHIKFPRTNFKWHQFTMKPLIMRIQWILHASEGKFSKCGRRDIDKALILSKYMLSQGHMPKAELTN